MDVNKLTAMANRLSIPQLQQAMRDGSLPAYVGMPLLQQKVQESKQAQAAQAAGRPQAPTVASQVEGEADQHEMMKRQALAMQEQMAGTGGISDMLRKPEAMAKGGAVAFRYGGDVGAIYKKLANGEPLTDEEKQALAGKPVNPSTITFPKYKPLFPSDPQPYTGPVPAINKQPGSLNVGAGSAQMPSYNAEQIKGYLTDAANKYNLDPNMLIAQANAESGLNPNARAKGSTAAGVGQFTEGTWKDYGTGNPDDRFNPKLSAEAMARYNRANIDKWGGDLQKGYASYHLGPNAPEEKLAADTAYTNKIFGQPIGIPSLQTTQAPQVADVYSNMEISKGSTPEEERAAMEKYLGPNKGLESLQGEISKLKDEAAADKEKAGWMSLLKAGLATMGGTSPYALTNIGAGAQAGVADFMDAQKEYRKERNRLVELQARADDAARQEARSIYEHGERSSQAKEAMRRSDNAEKRKGIQETAYQNAHLDLSNKAKDITAYGAQLEGTKLGLSDQMQEQQYLQAYAIVKDPNATPAQKEAAQGRIEAIKQMNMDKSPYAGLKQDQKLAFDYENAWQDYLSGKLYQDLPSGMTKEVFFNLLKGVPAAPTQQLKTSSGNPYAIRG